MRAALFIALLVLALSAACSARYSPHRRNAFNGPFGCGGDCERAQGEQLHVTHSAHHDPIVFRKMQKEAPFLRVLSLDGGGVRGIITTRILVALESEIQALLPNRTVSLGDYVDVFGGTSTGGIMALALLVGKTAEEVAQLWIESAPYIFSRQMKNVLGPAVEAGYKTDNLIDTFTREFPPDTPLSDFDDRSYAITAFDVGTYSSGLITRHTNSLRGGFFPWQVALATSAAPTYFPTAYITPLSGGAPYTMVDGGMMANNPTSIALGVAQDDFSHFSLNETVVFSVGAGVKTKTIEGHHNWGYTSWFLNGIIDMFLSGPEAGVDESVRTLFAQQPDQYARIQYKQKTPEPPVIPACEQADFSMDNVKADNLNLLRQCGDDLAAANIDVIRRMAKYFAFSHT